MIERNENTTDVLISGAGATGLVAALALRQRGVPVTLVGKLDTERSARTVALLDGSVRLLKTLNVFPRLLPYSAALRTIRIIDATGALFRAPTVEFEAAEIGLHAFGWNIENVDLTSQLRQLIDHHIDDHLVEYQFERDRVRAVCANGQIISARLVVAADGRYSPARVAAGIGTRDWTYPQVALTAILQHRLPHNDVSSEFHTRQGPFTLVPLPSAETGPRSSLVWLMAPHFARRLARLDPEALADAIERQSQSILGAVRLEGATGSFRMAGVRVEQLVAPRLALVGEAAHLLPPIGAQGLNLGLRDVAHLIDCIEASEGDPGSPSVLSGYADRRRRDIAVRTTAVDLLNRSLLSEFAPLDALRGAGLIALATIAPLRRAFMRAGVMPGGPPPRLMRS